MAKGLLGPNGERIVDGKVNLNQGKILSLDKKEPNVFIEITTGNKELIEKVGPDNLAKMFIPLAQLLTQFSEATQNKEMIIAFKNKGTRFQEHRTMGVRFVHGEKVQELLNDDFTSQFFPQKKEEEKKDEPKEEK